jgi:hypothetical protein
MKKKKRRLKTVEAKIAVIEAKHPGVNFKDMEIRRAFEAHFELVKELIHLRVDLSFCQSENRREMCSDCNCWKATAARCT